MERIKLYTHIDMDGDGSLILLKYFYPLTEIDVSFCGYGNIDKEIEEMIEDDFNYDAIYITDISPSEETLEKLEKAVKGKNIELRLFDHHKTALVLNKFDFCEVTVEKDGEAICGTKLFYNYLVEEKREETNETIDEFVKLVNDYDTWLWETKYHYDKPVDLNTLFTFYGKKLFAENMLEKFYANSVEFNEFDMLILNSENNKKKSYVAGKMKDLFFKNIQGKECVIVFAEQYTNELTSAMYLEYPECDIQIVIGQYGISYRCRNNESDIDVSEIAKHFGGGGHAKAAGSRIQKEARERYLDLIFED